MRNLLTSLFFVFISMNARAGIITIDYEFDLKNGDVYQCIGDSNASGGSGSNCFSNIFFGTVIPDTVITEDDTLKIDISFLPGQQLRWFDDGNIIFGQESEIIEIRASGNEQTTIRPSRYSFEFKDVSGDALIENSEILSPSVISGSAHFISAIVGIENLTDSFFDFSGISIEIDFDSLLTESANNFTTVDELFFSFISGEFEVLENVSTTPAPAPHSLSIFFIALFGLIIKRRT
jgi:hypothetical protein